MKKKKWMVFLGTAAITLGLAAGTGRKPASKPVQLAEEVPYIREITVAQELEEGETIRGQYIID